MMSRLCPRIAVGALCAIGATTLVGDAPALTVTSTVAVTASIAATCTVSTTAGLAFGVYDPVSANAATPKDGTATISVNCTTGSAAQISLDQGANAATGSTAAAPLRRVSTGGMAPTFLSYAIYQDAARTVVWGGDPTVDKEITGTGAAVTHTLYGRIPAGQNQPAGAYADSVIATVTF